MYQKLLKLFKSPLFINRLPTDLALLVNQKNEKEFIRIPDMFTKLNEEESAEILPTIDPINDIILSVPSNLNNICRTLDGSLTINSTNDINLSGSRCLINSIIVLPFIPKVKMSVPKGIKLKFNNPSISSYHYKIYCSQNVIQKPHIELSPEYQIPNYIIHQNLNFTIYIDLDQLKKQNKTIVIKENTPIIEIDFFPIYFIGSPLFPNIKNTYLLKNTEIYNNFEEVF